jgi:hypothetical protein
MPADPPTPTSSAARRRCCADLAAYLDSLSVHELADLVGELPNSRQEPLQWANDAADRHRELTMSGSVGWQGRLPPGSRASMKLLGE